MDFKCVAWLDNIYQKFEAICLQVEEETAKYVDDHVEIVCPSVKKLFSEVVEDFLCDSDVDPTEDAATDLTHADIKTSESVPENCEEFNEQLYDESEVITVGSENAGLRRRRNVAMEEDSEDNGAACGMLESKTPFSPNCYNLSLLHEAAESYRVFPCSPLEEFSSEEAAGPVYDDIWNGDLSTSGSLINSAYSEPTSPIEPAEVKQAAPSASGTSEMVMETGSDDSENTCHEVSECQIPTPPEDNLIMDVIEDVFFEPMAEINEQLDLSESEETCILVEEKKASDNQGQGEHKSFKKKIREALSTKMRSRKREYQRLAANHREQASTEDNEDKIVLNSTMKDLPGSAFTESEWEIL